MRRAVMVASAALVLTVALLPIGCSRQAATSTPPSEDRSTWDASAESVPPTPDWVTKLEVQHRHQENTPPRDDKSIRRSTDELVAAAGAEGAKLDSEDPEVREAACAAINRIASYASLPDAVGPLVRVATSDACRREYPGWWKGTDGPTVPGWSRGEYPVRHRAREALRDVWARIDFDSKLAGLSPEARKDALVTQFRGAGGYGRSRFAKIELLRTAPDQIVDIIAHTDYGPSRVMHYAAAWVYQVDHTRGPYRGMDARILGEVGTPGAVALLKRMLADPTCWVQPPPSLAAALPPPTLRPHLPPAEPTGYTVEYPVREAAAEELERMGVKVELRGHDYIVKP